MSLLDKAKALQPERKTKDDITDEELELALGWVRGEVSLTQVTKALAVERNWKLTEEGTLPASNYAGLVYSFMARALRKAINEKKV